MPTPAEQIAARLNDLTRRHTAFSGFQALLDAPGAYFPSLRTASTPDVAEREEITELADCYDAAQQHRDDPRRAYRS